MTELPLQALDGFQQDFLPVLLAVHNSVLITSCADWETLIY